ncbi:phage gp6-like head-tail connector protein [Agrobacterium tumefaciens]|uniref:head-tail connector protein n=1 Tax=Agrobacterium tumefaciens TaxID=358 RepID=UPI0015740F04|nr:head-tail connector protein [Agrobacterium tumefaciens]NSZ00610.1 phage gp6-like head-tail connector protein [Agrobacterium tumefaciens]NSZ38104.1 phage gp6-like head-tail connector protein [Agrobacterium tumefaciens]NTB25649.1 phage gp6-like head-tail connector protein [Agrobacterium tumefaciens]NTB27008.1 phage gp6-like head-tail connector protein [Agrobacterium tumefaciens]NTB32366.1 phage gp6-like head-tail connector protein [Agrobacterium tumefaciens]
MIISPDLAKQYLRIDHSEEDALIMLLIEGACEYVANYIGRSLDDLDPFPSDLKVAILKLVAFHYEVRNLATFGISSQIAPQTITQTLDNYRLDFFADRESSNG